MAILAAFVVALASTLTLHGQQAPLKNADIIQMAKANLGTDVIVAKIEASSTQFDTSTDALAVLKAAGVTDAIITAMIKAVPAKQAVPTDTTEASAAASESKATVYVYRPGKFMGKALEPSVFLDEQKILDMDNGRYFTLHLDAGRHILRSNEKNSEIDQTWDAGKIYYVKMTIATGMMKGHGQLAMVTERLADKEMHELRPLDSDNIEDAYKGIIDLRPIK
jgi:hypothetical protein